MFHLSACFVGSAAGGGDVFISSCGTCCDVLLACRLVSSLAPFRRLVGRVGSASLAPSCDTIGGEVAIAAGYRSPFRFLAACLVSPVLACLGSFLALPMIWMASGGWRSVDSVCCLLACPVVSVPCRLISSLGRSISWLVRWCGSVPSPDVVGMGSGGRSCHAVRPLVISGRLLRELVKTARAVALAHSSPFRLPAICVSSCPVVLSLPACRPRRACFASVCGRFPSVRCRRFALVSPRFASRSYRVVRRSGRGRLVPAFRLPPRYAYRSVPRVVGAERYCFPCRLFFSRVFLLVDDGVGERVFVVDGVVLENRGSDNPNIVAVV